MTNTKLIHNHRWPFMQKPDTEIPSTLAFSFDGDMFSTNLTKKYSTIHHGITSVWDKSCAVIFFKDYSIKYQSYNTTLLFSNITQFLEYIEPINNELFVLLTDEEALLDYYKY